MGNITKDEEEKRPLTKREVWNVIFLLLAWACTAANVTLVIGTSNVVALSIGTSKSMSALPLGFFFLGASFPSLLSPIIFKNGRKPGFLMGVGIGLVGTAFGIASIITESTILLIIACGLFGIAMVIGFSLRFAVIEVVPSHFSSKAVTLVVSGGCIAAFAGPESAAATKDIFGEDYIHLGVFMMTGVFNIANAIFTTLVQFPTSSHDIPNQIACRNDVVSILKTRSFLVPVMVSSFSWAIMTLPMSLFRVAVEDVGYLSRQGLTIIEFHFFGMYAPGFFSGYYISRFGTRKSAMTAVVLFISSLICLLLAPPAENAGSIALWAVGLVLIGVGWNFGFNGATIWLTKTYQNSPSCKSPIQAINDFFMFFFAGAWISSASFIYEAGGGGIEGWRLLNWVVIGLVSTITSILFFDLHKERHSSNTKSIEMPEDNSVQC